MNIVTNKENGNIRKIYINEKEVYPLNSNVFYVPEDYILGDNIRIEEMPENISFEMCYMFIGKQPIMSNESELTYSITKIDDGLAKIDFQTCFAKDSWNSEYDIDVYMKKAKDVVTNMHEISENINIGILKHTDKLVCLDFSSLYCSETFDSIIEYAHQIMEDYEVDLNIALNSVIRDIGKINTEADFRKEVMIPLLKKMRFVNVCDLHGINEYGKDIIFARPSEFGEYEYWGAQLKFGYISGAINGGIQKIIEQINVAFEMPFNDIYTKTEQYISKLLIVISQEYTENAKNRIIKSIKNDAIKNNIIFLDRPKVESLIDKYYN